MDHLVAQPGRAPLRRGTVACVVMGTVVVAAGIAVVALRIANPDAEPPARNWWLVAWFIVGLAYSVTGTALLAWSARRALGAAFIVVGLSATLAAVATQYDGYRDAGSDVHLPWLADAAAWAWPLGSSVLVTIVAWQLLPSGWRRQRWTRAADVVAVLATAAIVVTDGVAHDVGEWVVAVVATAGTLLLANAWWRARFPGGDPLRGWVLAGSVAAWLATVPSSLDVTEWRLTGRDVVFPLLLLLTVPLTVAGALIELIREAPARFHRISHRVAEWVLLAGGIVVIYTGLVAGLGRLVGGSGPTWLLVAATGAIAVAIEPARERIRHVVDHLVYGTRDDPLAVVQQVVDQVGADSGDDLLPALARHLARELCLDGVAIELATPDGWRRVAAAGRATGTRREVLLHHRGEVVGRLVADGDLRARDDEVLDQLAGPLSLAVSWVRLAGDLRRSSVAIVSAREEERRRLRRDLHDGVGPALTGISLGLRTAITQLSRSPDAAELAPATGLLQHIADEVDALVGELKRIVRDLRPTALDQLGLLDAVAEFTRTFKDDLEIHLALPPAPVELPAAVEVAVYRIVTEAVTNVVRHAGAAQCWLRIRAGDLVEIEVVDDGVGIPTTAPPGVGLTAMHERASELGGTMRLLPNRPSGTRVLVKLPAALP